MRTRRVTIIATAVAAAAVLAPQAWAAADPELVSALSDGSPVDGRVSPGQVSDDGNRVAFVEYDEQEQVHRVRVRDRAAGRIVFTYATVAVIPEDGVALSGNGRYVAINEQFGHDGNVTLIVHDLVDHSEDGVTNREVVTSPSLSDSGREIAYLGADALTSGDTVYVKDLDTSRTTRLSNSGALAFSPVISGDGAYVAYRQYGHVYSRSVATGTLTRVDVLPDGSFGTRGNAHPVAFSDTGKFLLFTADVSDLAPGTAACGDGGNGCAFRRNFIESVTTVASKLPDGTVTTVAHAALSGDARVVAFDAAPGDPNLDVYVRVLSTATTRLASVNGAGEPANAAAYHPELTDDGAQVAFGSAATNLGHPDVAGPQAWIARGK